MNVVKRRVLFALPNKALMLRGLPSEAAVVLLEEETRGEETGGGEEGRGEARGGEEGEVSREADCSH